MSENYRDEEFNSECLQGIQIVNPILRRLLRLDDLAPEAITGIGRLLEGLEALSKGTEPREMEIAEEEFGERTCRIVYEAGEDEFREWRDISIRLTPCEFSIEKGFYASGSYGGDYHTSYEWKYCFDEGRTFGALPDDLSRDVEELLALGAKVEAY